MRSGNVNMNSYYNPYRVLIDLYEMNKDCQKLLVILHKLELTLPNDQGLKQRIRDTEEKCKQQTAVKPLNDYQHDTIKK